MRKKRSLSSIEDSAGEVADGLISTTPFGTATLLAIAVVTPEQSAPTIPMTLSLVTRRSAAAVAAPASMQVESARMAARVVPSRNSPEAFASAIASSAEDAMSGVSDSMGPVKPRTMPIFAESAWLSASAPDDANAAIAVPIRNVFMM